MMTTSGSEPLVIPLHGRMDTTACTACEADILNRVRTARGPITFDMKAVDYVSSMFLRLCVQVVQSAGTANFALADVHPEIKKVFKIAGLDRQIRIS